MVLCSFFGMAAANAQTAPDAGSLLRQSEQQAPKLPTLPKIEAPKMLEESGTKTLVTSFTVEGSTRFSADRFTALLADLTGKQLGFAQLQLAADRVAALYRANGLHATAFLPEQTLQDGKVLIKVLEGHLEALKVEPGSSNHRPVPSDLVTHMLSAGQTPGQIIDTRALERMTLIANDVPGVRVSSVLAGGAAPGTSDIIATVDSRPLLSGAFSADNQDPRATGAAKLGANVGLADWAGIGDQTLLDVNATQGKQYGSAAYSVPLGASGLRGGVSASYMKYRLLDEFAALGGRGLASTFGVNASYPIIRSANRDLYLTASFEHRHLVNDVNAGNLSDKTDSALTVGLNGDANDTRGGGGAMLGGLSMTSGKLDLGGDAADLAADRTSLQRAGTYVKFTGNLARLQRLSAAGSLWLSVNGQYASKNLDSSEQFSLGGPYGVRAYPVLEATGDEGLIATLEYRRRLSDAFELDAFYDFGHIVRERDPLPTAAPPNSYSLQGAGAGVQWNVKRWLLLHAVVATRIGVNPAANANGTDSDGTKRRPQFWLLANVPF
jgi:hemolysin activation/secretion protein